MKYNRIFNNVALVMLAVLAVFFTACSEDEDDSKSGGVKFEAFGPSPALRGSQLTIIGRNLDKVTSVILPENIEITDIEVINKDQIKITIPQNAKEGYIKLIAQGVELASKTLLTYTEPISITKIEPISVKAGQKVTIEGDYLNLILKVVFADSAVINSKDFITWEREKIEVILPREARTGIIILADTAAIPLELKSEIELQVVLPSVDKVLDLTNKKPGEEISVSGKDLDLVKSVELPNGESVKFSIKDDVLSFTLPEGVTDGAIVMVAYSGVHVAIANIGMAVPSELVVTPAIDIKAGDVITVKGINMELVTTVTFPGVTNGVTPTSKTATEIKLTMPDAAISGDLVLNTASGNTASVAISTLKPEVLSYEPALVAAGSDVVLKGKHLDLVTKVTFGGNKIVEVTSISAAELKVTVPVDAETGEVTLTMKNGETVKCASLEVTKPVFAYIPELPGADAEINAGTPYTFVIANGDKLTGVQINGVAVQYILSGSNLLVGISDNANGKTTLKLISSNGEVSYDIQVIGKGGPIETVAWSGLVALSWSAGGRVYVPYSAFEPVKAGSILKIYFSQSDAWGQCQINDGSWGGITFSELGGNTLSTDNAGGKSATTIELVLTQAILTQIAEKKGEDGANNPGIINGIIMQGSDWAVSKVSIITAGAPVETTIYQGPYELSWSGVEIRLNKDIFTGLAAGSIMTFYYVSSGNTQVKFQDANWGGIDISSDPHASTSDNAVLELPASETSYGITLTAAMLNTILTVDDGWGPTGLIFKGQEGTINKITIK
jgi:hypothetical protein